MQTIGRTNKMNSTRLSIFLICSVLVFTGCDSNDLTVVANERDAAQHNVVSKGTQAAKGKPFHLMLGVLEDLSLFVTSEQSLYFDYQCPSRLDWPQGATLHGKFGRVLGNDIVTLDVMAQNTEKDGYSITGTYESTEPFVVTLRGTGDNESDDIALEFDAGSGELGFYGTLRNTYSKDK